VGWGRIAPFYISEKQAIRHSFTQFRLSRKGQSLEERLDFDVRMNSMAYV